MTDADQRLMEADRIGFALTDIRVELRRIGDVLTDLFALLHEERERRAQQANAPSASRSDAPAPRQRKPRTCEGCGVEMAGEEPWKKLCSSCFTASRGSSRRSTPPPAEPGDEIPY
jgi:hypothetical protein